MITVNVPNTPHREAIPTNRDARQYRVAHANQLTTTISQHGRRFFYSPGKDRTACMELDDRGRVWFVDDYTGKRVYTHHTGFTSRWRGFSHGGTLRALVEAMRDYIVTGQQIPLWRIATASPLSAGDIWGYGHEAAALVRDTAYALPIIAQDLEAREQPG